MTPISITKRAYTMASVDGNDATMELYGEICERQPIDWWTGEPIPGEYITLDEFLDDLKRIEGCKSLTIRINSYGGDAGVSLTIHNRLRELAAKGVKLTGIVDGYAMSGGSLIMCACDTVKANPASLIMIHKCISMLWGVYNADELREQATMQDAWDKTQSEIYQRKTGLSNTVVLHMMSENTYMTGREAKAKGFVDELLEDADPVNIAASADGRSIFVRGRQMHLAPGMFAPDVIPTVNPEADASVETHNEQPAVTGGEEGGHSMTTQELREQYPEQVAEVEAGARADVDHTEAVNAAVQAERDRLSSIDEIAGLFDPQMVQEAKYGETRCSAAELTLRAAQAAAKAGSKFLGDAAADANASGTAAVGAAPAPADDDEQKTPEAKAAEADAVVHNLLHKDKKEDK